MSRGVPALFALRGAPVEAVVLSIGTELVDGHLTDTNLTFLAQELTAIGIPLLWSAQVGDDLELIVRLLERAWRDARLIVSTGGIGPTQDDLTREAIAHLLDEPLTVDEALAEHIRAFFAARGLPMPEQNLKQAFRIPSCEPLPNPIGTAPGWFVERDDHLIVTMPGVPREMVRMWREQAVPRLLPRLGGGVIRFRTLKTIGLGESLVEEHLRDLIAHGTPRIATYAKDDGVHVRITARASEPFEAERQLAEAERTVRERLGTYVYGVDDTTLGRAILEPLARAGWTLAVVEDGSGGRLAGYLVDEPLASRILRRVTVYAESAESEGTLGKLARARATAEHLQSRADCIAAVLVRFDSSEQLDRTTGEIYLYGVTPQGEAEREHRITAHPQEIRRRAGLWAAEFLWRLVTEVTKGFPESSASSP